MLDRLSQADGAPRRDAGDRQGGDAPQATVIGAMLLKLGYADGMICGMTGQYSHHLGVINQIIGKRPGVNTLAAMNYLMLRAARCSSATPMSTRTRAPRKSPR
jgi:phosphotransacetylase